MSSAEKSNEKAQQAPRTLLQLFWLVIKGFFKNIPKMIKSQIIKLVIIFIAVIVINTYLVVVKNEGFAPTPGNKFLPVTALQGMMNSATIFWSFAAFFISNIFGRIRTGGLKLFFSEVFGFPGFLAKNFQESRGKGLATLLFSMAFALPITLLFNNKYTLILYTLMAFFSYTMRERGFLLYVLKLGSDDLRRIVKKKGAVNPALLYIMVMGTAIAFLISVFLPWKPFSVIFLALLMLVLAVLRLKNKVTPGAVTAILAFTAANFLFARLTGHVFADDGGWQEAGGTFDSWVKSPGAGTAVKMGVPPALGSLLGGFLGGLGSSMNLPGILSGINLNSGWDGNSGPDGKALQNIRDQLASALENAQNELVEPNNESLVNWSSDLIKNILGTSQGMDMLGSFLKSTGLGTFGEDAVDAFQSFMKNNMAVNELGELVFSGDSAQRMTLLKDMVNSSKANQILSGVGKGLFWGGAFVDAMMNYGLGDGAVLAGTKAITNAYLMGALGDANPGLGVMELGNFVLFGGSQAADCISPSKTIIGAVNLAFDMMFKDPKEWQDRLKDGVYGPNMKNFVDGAGIMKDAMTNPQQFWKEWSEAVQSNPDSDMWKDMYNSSFELWNLPDNVNTDLSLWHPLDAIRTVGCALGKQATDNVIGIGEGMAKLGQKLGDFVGSNDTLNTLVDKAGDAAGYAADGAGKIANAAWQGSQYVGKTAVNLAKNAASNAYDGLNNLTGGAVDSAVDMAGKAAGKIGDAASTAAGAIKDGAGYVIDSANSAVDSTVNAIGNAWDYMGTWFD